MLKKIITVFAVAIIGVLVFAANKPDTFRYQRSITINAPAEKIFPLINDYPSWPSWSPYENKDPAMKRTMSGPKGGVGAIYEWDGNNQVGQGRMETVEVTAPSKIVIKLDFFKPFEAHNTAEFSLEPQGASTKVTWAMFGPNNYIGKVMSLMIDCDKMVGNDFEVGLLNLKAVAEK